MNFLNKGNTLVVTNIDRLTPSVKGAAGHRA
jgi:hypothetical protein